MRRRWIEPKAVGLPEPTGAYRSLPGPTRGIPEAYRGLPEPTRAYQSLPEAYRSLPEPTEAYQTHTCRHTHEITHIHTYSLTNSLF